MRPEIIAALTLPNLWKMIVGIATENWVRYAVTAGIAWLLAYVWFKKKWWSRKIIQRDPSRADIRREMGWSLLTALIYGAVGTLTIWLTKFGHGHLYRKIEDYGWVWFWCSIVVTIFVHDAYFYWTHRMMHHPRLYRWFHRVHHESVNPSPWAAYAFGPLEAMMQVMIFPLIVFTIPIHPYAFMIFMVWQIVWNVIGHTGFEYHPKWLMDSWISKFINTPTNHIQHHEKFRGNYSLYFNIWDRLMGTNHPDYEKRFREVTSRGE